MPANSTIPSQKTAAIERFDPDRCLPPDAALLAAAVARAQAAGPRLILWDLVGSCNLRCPSCPVGNMAGTNPRGLISDDLFHRILEKLAREFPKWQLHFYNWTEPLIHPRINEYCKAAADAGFHLHLSSNLNHLKDAEGLMAAGMKTFRISLSGFTQAVYEQGHRGGNVQKVKLNMIRLSQAEQATGSRTRIHVYFHKYRHNLQELPVMESFARELGFDFISDWAFLMPLEKMFHYLEGELPADQRGFAEDHIVPAVDDAVALMQPHRDQPCELIDQLVMDFQGNLALCCATYDGKANFIANYLDIDWMKLQQMRYGHSTCTKCAHYGLHVLYTHLARPELKSQMEQLAQRHLQRVPAPHDHRTIKLPILLSSALAESA